MFFVRRDTGNLNVASEKEKSRWKTSLLKTLFVNPISRFFYMSVVVVAASTSQNYVNYRGYWHGTIRRVQTVDFNILSHTLPNKLSQALAIGDKEEIQRTINSNFGLFGIVVTDCRVPEKTCSGEKILYITDSNLTWRKQLTSNVLANSDYDLLRNPPPLYAEAAYDSSRDETRRLTGLRNSGEIIGRVYYVRGIPPTFFEDYSRWVQEMPTSLISSSGTSKYYSLTSLFLLSLGLASWYQIEAVHRWRRQQKREDILRLKQQKLEAELRLSDQQASAKIEILKQQQTHEIHLREAQTKAQLYQQQLNGKISEVAQLEEERKLALRERQRALDELRQFQEQEHKRLEQLNLDLQQKEDQIVQSVAAQVTFQKTITKSRDILTKQQGKISQLQANLANTSEASLQIQESLQQELRLLQEQQQLGEKKLRSLLTEYQSKAIAAQEAEQLVQLLREQVVQSKQRSSHFQQQTNDLQHSVEVLNTQSKLNAEQIRHLQQEAQEAQKKAQEAEEKAREAEQEVLELRRQDVNKFEQKVTDTLHASPEAKSESWLIMPCFDVGGKEHSQMTDAIVVGESFIAVIEAKECKGRIAPEHGSACNDTWYSYGADGNRKKVLSSKGNPYKQTHAYATSVLGLANADKPILRFESRSKYRIPSFGIIVFPEGADVSAIESGLPSEYYYVATLDTLLAILRKIEDRVKNKVLSRQLPYTSAVKIAALLSGRFSSMR